MSSRQNLIFISRKLLAFFCDSLKIFDFFWISAFLHLASVAAWITWRFSAIDNTWIANVALWTSRRFLLSSKSRFAHSNVRVSPIELWRAANRDWLCCAKRAALTFGSRAIKLQPVAHRAFTFCKQLTCDKFTALAALQEKSSGNLVSELAEMWWNLITFGGQHGVGQQLGGFGQQLDGIGQQIISQGSGQHIGGQADWQQGSHIFWGLNLLKLK